MIFDINKSNIVLLNRKKENVTIVLGKQIKIEDSDEEQDPDFIYKLLKETEIKKATATTNQKIEVKTGSGADIIRQ